jgi:hypothetical protein
MNPQNDKDNELKHQEKELEKREQLLRLREIEVEIYEKEKSQETFFYSTRKENPPEGRLKRWRRTLVNITKFFGFVLATVVTIRIVYGLAIIIMVGGVVWIFYKIFLEKDTSNR